MEHHRWVAALVAACNEGIISDQTLGRAVRLSSVMLWSGAKPGLYWSNEAVWNAVGMSKASFYRACKELVDAGLLERAGQNLHPCASRRSATGSLKSATASCGSETHMVVTTGGGGARGQQELPALTSETSLSSINDLYPDAQTDDSQFSRLMACGLTVNILRRWPTSPVVNTQRLVDRFEQALQQYSREVLFTSVGGWLEDRREDQSMNSPAAIFLYDSWRYFASAATTLSPKEAAQ